MFAYFYVREVILLLCVMFSCLIVQYDYYALASEIVIYWPILLLWRQQYMHLSSRHTRINTIIIHTPLFLIFVYVGEEGVVASFSK